MLSLEMLDVAIGVIFIYLLLSLICSALNEFIESKLKLRSVDLEQGIRELLNDPNGATFAKKIYDHPLVYSLFRGDYKPEEIRNVESTIVKSKRKRYTRGTDLPSYIPARNFALALMDAVLPATSAGNANNTLSGSAESLAPQNSSLTTTNAAGLQQQPVNPNPLHPLRNAVELIQDNDHLKRALLTIIDAAGDNAMKAREGIESWFNSSMDRVSGWYKRRVQHIIFVMGFVIAIAMNADTFAIFKNLANDRPLRNSIVAQAQAIKTFDTDSATSTKKIQDNVNDLLAMGLPIGWGWKSELNPNAVSNLNAVPEANFGNWFLKFLGWLTTGLAISLGAPFWFDLLNKIMVIRSTVKPHEKSLEESSDDK